MALSMQTPPPGPATLDLYRAIKEFRLRETSVHVENLMLNKDSLRFVLTGDLYFAEPVAGGVYGAVFLGQGRFSHEAVLPWEQESVKRFQNTNVIESTFTKAVFRFSDDTYEKFAGQPAGGAPPLEAQRLASSLDEHLIRETGLNLSARLFLSVLNKERPGVFFAEVDGGSRGRLSAVLDHQARVPSRVFGVNGGEKGLILKYETVRFGTDVWAAFYSEDDYSRGTAQYSDAFDLVSIPQYRLEVDLRDPGNWVKMQARPQFSALMDGVQVIPMGLNEGLGEFFDDRLNKGMRVLSAELSDGTPVGFIQEPWETGISLILPKPLSKGQTAQVAIKLEGKDALTSWGAQFHYPRSTTTWYPRHGYLARSRFEVIFHHDKTDRIASIGQRRREEAVQNNEWVTEWVSDDPVALVTFVCGPFQRHAENTDISGRSMPIEYYSPPGSIARVKEDFIQAEIANAVRYFENLFGQYPYGRISGAFFPTNYGQGFPTLLLLPARGTAVREEFAFLAHETAHQWWGHIVSWRSYRDQWLSEGFAEYSGLLYTGLRSNQKDAREMLELMRRELLEYPQSSLGTAKMKLYANGPLTLGTRLHSSRTLGGYNLVYVKGALVLRALHFLLSNPETADDSGFFDMMKDFVNRHRNGVATTESFMQVAGEHFARSPNGQKYKLKDLSWFLTEWIYQTGLPSYELEYKVEPREGGFVLRGTLLQKNVPERFAMILPLTFEFSGGRKAHTSIPAIGPKTPVEIRLPEKPRNVRLDPDLWIPSEKTSEKGG
jgi:hypothetical protein